MTATVPTPCDSGSGAGRYGARMAESTEATEVDPADGAEPAQARRVRGTTRLSRLSAALAWFVGLWFLANGLLYPPLLVLGALVVWLGIGAWKGRRRRTTALAVITALAAAYYPAMAWWRWTHADVLRDFSYPGSWIAILAVQSTLLLTIAVTAALSLRRATGAPATTDTALQA